MSCWRRTIGVMLAAAAAQAALYGQAAPPSDRAAGCAALLKARDHTITFAELVAARGETPSYCYVRGTILPSIRFHMQLPLAENWNGRLLNIGDGGKDGDLDYADDRVAQGYAVANSNMGHDAGAEPNSSFAWNNRRAEIDFGYRAVHLTAAASKSIVRAYYGKTASHAYFEGCSQGGRSGFMEAQRFPYDFDGIVAGAPVFRFQAINIAHVVSLQKMFREHFAGNLAADTNHDGIPDSLARVTRLHQKVLEKCDALDGIRDGVIDDPLACEFRPERDLQGELCAAPGANQETCFSELQLKNLREIYRGPTDSKGVLIVKGMAVGSEFGWGARVIPHAGNHLFPTHLGYEVDHVNFLFYENDPGVPPPDVTDLSYKTSRTTTPPEFAWWEFNPDDFTSGKGKLMSAITDAVDPDLARFVGPQKGKLLVYHGWADGDVHPEPTLDYYKDVVKTTFKGSVDEARKSVRLFMLPGMDHCGGGPGPNTWDRLAPLVAWVEHGDAPDYLVATHATAGRIDNERKVCAYPQKAVYTGPAGGENDRTNWVASNFVCR